MLADGKSRSLDFVSSNHIHLPRDHYRYQGQPHLNVRLWVPPTVGLYSLLPSVAERGGLCSPPTPRGVLKGLAGQRHPKGPRGVEADVQPRLPGACGFCVFSCGRSFLPPTGAPAPCPTFTSDSCQRLL